MSYNVRNPKQKALIMLEILRSIENEVTFKPELNHRLFGSAVKARREELGISQEELGGRAGLHRTYVCDVERGARNVSLDSIIKLAVALQIQPAALFGTFEALAPIQN